MTTTPTAAPLSAEQLDELPLHFIEGVENGGYYLASDVARLIAQARTTPQATAPQPVGERALPVSWRRSLPDTEFADLRAALDMRASSAPADEAARLRKVLVDVRHALQFASDSPGGAISDTLWMMHSPETVFDFIDAALASPTATPSSAAPAAQAVGAVAWLITTKEPKAGYPLATCNADVVRSTTPGIHIVTPLAPAASVAQAGDAKDAARYRKLRDAEKIPAAVWHALETGVWVDDTIDGWITETSPILFCEPCKAGRYDECQYALPCTLPAPASSTQHSANAGGA